MSRDNEDCGGCIFFEPHGVGEYSWKGLCKRQSPQVIPVKGFIDTDLYSRWPEVHSTEWCGEWKKQKEESHV